MNLIPFAHELTLSAIDLTRACAAHELYDTWCGHHAHTPAAIAQYFAAAAIELEEQLHSAPGLNADAFVARETLADLLIASAPLTAEELVGAVQDAIADAQREQIPLFVSPSATSNDSYFGFLAEVSQANGYEVRP